MSAPQARTVELSGSSTRCLLEGPADAPVVVLAHALLADASIWDALVPLLAPRWRVLRFDLRGHGTSPASTPPYAMRALADDAIAVLDALGFDRVHYVGLSLGGMIGQQLGAHFGNRLLSLTLANTTGVQAMPEAWDQRMATARERGVAALEAPTLERWFTPGFRASNPGRVAQVGSLIRNTPLAGYLGAASAVRNLDHRGLLGSIAVPTLVLAGALDTATPPAQSEHLQAAIPNARLQRIDDAAHLSVVEQPATFGQAVAAWFERCEAH